MTAAAAAQDRNESEVTFSFGANWRRYVQNLTPQRIDAARDDVERWVGRDAVAGRRVVDIGCGSGVHSLAFFDLGAGHIVSFDRDPASVEATRSLWERAGRPAHWQVHQGSILDPELVAELATPGFDLVYSWGVLHHTGAMWQALDNAIELLGESDREADNGLLWIALYAKGPRYARDLALKQRYNRASPLGQRWIYATFVAEQALKWLLFRRFDDLRRLLLPHRRDRERGMSMYHDIIDWLGGLPYEVASVGEVVDLTRRRGLILEKVETSPEGGNHVFLLSRRGGDGRSGRMVVG